MAVKKITVTRAKPLVLLHISPKKNRKSILRNGLIVNDVNSGYGKPPELNAVYLYHENNINVIYEMVETFDDFDVYEVTLTDPEALLPDEDSKKDTWEESLESFGTVAYSEDIDKRQVKFMMNVNTKAK